MRRIVGPLLLVFLLLLALAAPASAAPPFKDSTEGESMSAFSFSCGPATCTDTFVDVFPVGEGLIVVCLGEFTFNIHSGRQVSGDSACSDELSSDALAIDGDLSSATLAPTAITFFDCNRQGCTEGDTVTVSAELTGVGGVSTSTTRERFTDGECTFRFTSMTESRAGTGSITIDDETLSADGNFGSGKFTFMERCS